MALHVQRLHSSNSRGPKKNRAEQVQRFSCAQGGLEALGEAFGELSDGEVGSVVELTSSDVEDVPEYGRSKSSGGNQ